MKLLVLTATLALAVLGSACSGSSRTDGRRVDSRQDQAVGLEGLERDLEATVLENYSQLTLGNIEAYREGISANERVVLFGLSPLDVVLDHRQTARDRRLYRRLGPTLLSKNLDVHLSTDGSVGWVFDDVSYRVPYIGREASIPIRTTAMFVRDVERWVMVMEHQSYALPIDEIISMGAAGRLPQPRRFKTIFDKKSGQARQVLSIVGRLHNDDSERYRRRKIASADDALVVLPGPDEHHGNFANQSPSLASLFGDGTTVGIRDYRIQVARSKEVAWMAANLVVHTTVNDDAVEFGLRGTYVLENRENHGWMVVQMHVAAPIFERELSRRVFGTGMDVVGEEDAESEDTHDSGSDGPKTLP
jgi:hypothetical protein